MTTHDTELLAMAQAMARRYTVPGYETEDLTQEAYLAMLSGSDHSRHGAWVRAWSRLKRLARAARARRSYSLSGDVPARVESAEQTEEPSELLALVRKVLSPRDAGVLIAIYWEGRSCAEVAQTLGLTRIRVYQIRARAVDRLAVELAWRRSHEE